MFFVFKNQKQKSKTTPPTKTTTTTTTTLKKTKTIPIENQSKTTNSKQNHKHEKNKNKTVVFAMHHPMFTNGTHGGFFGANKHLYPTQQNIPLPGLSSLVAQIRSQGGVSVQDRYNELYNKFMNKLAIVARKHGNLAVSYTHLTLPTIYSV